MDPIEHPCDSCRIKQVASNCLAKRLANLHLCGLVRDRDEYATLVLEQSGGESAPIPPTTATPNPQLAEFQAKLAAMQACPNWRRGSSVEGCGCGYNWCSIGKGKNGKVRTTDCIDCLDGK